MQAVGVYSEFEDKEVEKSIDLLKLDLIWSHILMHSIINNNENNNNYIQAHMPHSHIIHTRNTPAPKQQQQKDAVSGDTFKCVLYYMYGDCVWWPLTLIEFAL